MRAAAAFLVCAFLGAGYALGVSFLAQLVQYLQTTPIGG